MSIEKIEIEIEIFEFFLFALEIKNLYNCSLFFVVVVFLCQNMKAI